MDPWVKSQEFGGEEQKRWKEKTEKKLYQNGVTLKMNLMEGYDRNAQ